MTDVSGFFGPHRFLSNFYPATVEMDGFYYPTVEHAYQAAKSDDEFVRLEVASLLSPSAAKHRGQSIAVRPGWWDMQLAVMYILVRDKFTRHGDLANRLRATGSARLVEANDWGDTFWGVCRGRGSNHLGEILMRVRQEIAT